MGDGAAWVQVGGLTAGGQGFFPPAEVHQRGCHIGVRHGIGRRLGNGAPGNRERFFPRLACQKSGTQIGQHDGVILLAVERRAIRGDRLIDTAQILKGFPEISASHRVFGVYGDGLPVKHNCFLGSSKGEDSRAEVDICIDEIRTQGDRIAISLDGF